MALIDQISGIYVGFDPLSLSKPAEYLQFDLDALDQNKPRNKAGQVLGKLKVAVESTEDSLVVRHRTFGRPATCAQYPVTLSAAATKQLRCEAGQRVSEIPQTLLRILCVLQGLLIQLPSRRPDMQAPISTFSNPPSRCRCRQSLYTAAAACRNREAQPLAVYFRGGILSAV